MSEGILGSITCWSFRIILCISSMCTRRLCKASGKRPVDHREQHPQSSVSPLYVCGHITTIKKRKVFKDIRYPTFLGMREQIFLPNEASRRNDSAHADRLRAVYGIARVVRYEALRGAIIYSRQSRDLLQATSL